MTEARYLGPSEPDEEAQEDVLEAAADEAEPDDDGANGAPPEGVSGSEPQSPAGEPLVLDEASDDEARSDGQPAEHAGGVLGIPDGYSVLEGTPSGARRGVAVVVSRFNGDVTRRLLVSALGELERRGVARESVTIIPVPGAFELPLGAMAFAKTRRFACVVALGCVIRGETPHFEYVSGEAASGLQLAALETGVPVSFGVLTVENREQALARIEKGAEAVRSALEMADLFAQLRQTAAAGAR